MAAHYPYPHLIILCLLIYTLYVAWEHSRNPNEYDGIEKFCYGFWSLSWIMWFVRRKEEDDDMA